MTTLRSSLAARATGEARPPRASVDELERRAWRERRIMLVKADDPETPGLVRMWMEARARVRFGS